MPVNRKGPKKVVSSYSFGSDDEQTQFDFEVSSCQGECSTDLEYVLQQLGFDGDSSLRKNTKPTSRKKELRIVESGIHVFGHVANLGVKTLGDRWTECIPSKILDYLNEKGDNRTVNPLQDWMNTMILEDYSGAIMYGEKEDTDRKKKEAENLVVKSMVYSLISRLINKIRSGVSTRMEVNCVEEMYECFLEEQISVVQPYSLLICSSQKEASDLESMVRECLHSYPKIKWDHVTESLIETLENPHPSALLIGTISNIRAYLTEFSIDMGRLDSVYITGCQNYAPGSERSELLEETFNYIRLLKQSPISTFLSFTKHMIVDKVLLDLLPKNWSLVVAEPVDTAPGVKFYLCSKQSPKINWLAGIVEMLDQIKEERSRYNKTTLIICESTSTCTFLALSIHQKLQSIHPARKIEVPCITRNSHFLGVERSVNAIQSKSATFMVIERGRLGVLEAENYANLIVFDLPPPDQFLPLINTLYKLCSSINDQSPKSIHLLFHEDKDLKLVRPVYKFLQDSGTSIPQILAVIHDSLNSSFAQ